MKILVRCLLTVPAVVAFAACGGDGDTSTTVDPVLVAEVADDLVERDERDAVLAPGGERVETADYRDALEVFASWTEGERAEMCAAFAALDVDDALAVMTEPAASGEVLSHEAALASLEVLYDHC